MVTQTELEQLRDAARQQAVSLSALCHDLLVQAVSQGVPELSQPADTKEP